MTDPAPAPKPVACSHPDTWFDRTLCPPPCNTMHTCCTECGKPRENCAHQTMRPQPQPTAPDTAAEMLAELVGLVTDEPDIPGHSDWLDAWNDAWERAIALVEAAQRRLGDDERGREQ